MRENETISLISLSLKSKATGLENEELLVEATDFYANTHVEFLRELVSNNEKNNLNWAFDVKADNTNTNEKIARMLILPLIGCNSHKLNLQVNHMLEKDAILEDAISSAHRTMQ